MQRLAAASHRVFQKTEDSPRGRTGSISLAEENGFSEESVTKYIAGNWRFTWPSKTRPEGIAERKGAEKRTSTPISTATTTANASRSTATTKSLERTNRAPDCGRTYPHKHIRALRPGGEGAAEEESDENADSD